MKAFLLAAMLAFSFFSINFAGAFSSSILNGDFSSALPQATPVCNYFINSSQTSAKDCALGASSLHSLPVSWQVDTNTTDVYFDGPGTTPMFDSVMIVSTGNGGQNLAHSTPFATLLYSTIPGALHPDSFCSYNSNLVPGAVLTCSGASQPGNYTAEGFIKQTVNINKSGARLHYWVSPAFPVPNPNKINQSSGQEFYTCSAGSPLNQPGSGGSTQACFFGLNFLCFPNPSPNDCGVSNPRYRVQIKRLFANGSADLSANGNILNFEEAASAGASSENSYQEKVISLNVTAGDNVTIVFASVGLNFAPTTLSAILLDDVSIEYPADTAAMATKFISDHETLSPVGISLVNAANSTGDIVNNYKGWDLNGFINSSRDYIRYFRISKNFSDFYKFDMNLTFNLKSGDAYSSDGFICTSNAVVAGACLVADGFPKDFWGYDSSGGIYNISALNIRNASNGGCAGTVTCGLEIFGYIPSNVTNISLTYRASINTHEQEITLNFSLDPNTVSNRRNWKSPNCDNICFPVLNSNETWSYVWPLFFYNFSYNTNSQNLSFWTYNFRNSTSFYPSMNLSEGSGINNVFLFDSNGNSLASGSDTKTYAQEFTFDFSNIAFDNSAIVGNSIIINRTSANPWYNETKTVSQSKFVLSVAGPNAGCSNFCGSASCAQGSTGTTLCSTPGFDDKGNCVFTPTLNSPTCGGNAPPTTPSGNGTQTTPSGTSSFDVGESAGAYRAAINTFFRPDFIWIMVPFIVIFAVEIYSMVKTGHALGLDFRVWLGFVAAWIFVGTFLVAIIGPLAGILIIAALVLLIVGRTYQAVVGGGTG